VGAPAFNELPPQPVWTFNGITPSPLIKSDTEKLGNPGAGSVLLRLHNSLPEDNGGFGLPSVTTHLDNGQTPLESDGFPCFFMERGQLRSPLSQRLCPLTRPIPVLEISKKPCTRCNINDHRIDHTAENHVQRTGR